MHARTNARLTQRARLRLVSQHLVGNNLLPELVAEAGISLRYDYKWLARYRSGGSTSLADRHSFGRQKWLSLDPKQLQQTAGLHYQRVNQQHSGRLLAARLSTALILGKVCS